MTSRILLLCSAAAVCAGGLAAMGRLDTIFVQGSGARGRQKSLGDPDMDAVVPVIASDSEAISHNNERPLAVEIASGARKGAEIAMTDNGIVIDAPDSPAVCRTDERAGAVNEALSRMKASHRDEVATRIMSDTGDFLVALAGALAGDNGAAGGDLPLLFLIDKTHSVGADYVPRGLVPLDGTGSYTVSRKGLSLRPEAAAALERMAQAARKDGVTLMASSTYRSYDYQKTVYNKWVKIDGQEEADRESAQPGHSQHQLGAAADFGSITDDFDQTRAGRWMYAHAADWGWSLSFPKGYEAVTGYRWECWHFRYIGREACRLQDEWFGGVQQYMMEFIDIYRSLIGGLS